MSDNNSKSEMLEALCTKLLKALAELKAVERFLDEVEQTGEVSSESFSSIKLEEFKEATQTLGEVYPHLKNLQKDQALKEALEIFGVTEEVFGNIPKN